MEIYIREIPNDFSFKKSLLAKNKDNIQTLVMGNSHGYYGINPTFLKPSAFNLCHISQTLKCNLDLLEHYQALLPKLKNLILVISPFNLYHDFSNSPEGWRNKNYLIYYDIGNANQYKDYSEVLSLRFFLNYRRLRDFYLRDSSFITCDSMGWGIDYENQVEDIMISAKKTAAKHIAYNTDNITLNVNYIQKIITLCQKNNINLQFIIPPYSDYYINELPSGYLQSNINTIDSIINANDLILNNFSDSDLFNENDFYDGDHLNHLGAKKLSIAVSELLN